MLGNHQTAVWAPKRPEWMVATVVVSAAVVIAYSVAAWRFPWQPGRLGGLVAGSVAAALFVNAGLYPLRRRWRARPLGTAQRWLQLHVYGSVVGAVLTLVHVGFRWPFGTFGWVLLLLTLWTALSGLLGVFLQKRIPLVLSRSVPVEPIYERIPELVKQLCREADALMVGAPAVVERLYQTEVRGMLTSPTLSSGYLLDPRVRPGLLSAFSQLTPYIDGPDRDRVRELQAIVEDKLGLDAQLSLQRAMRVWLCLHVPPAAVLLGLLVVHVFAVVYL